MRKQSSQTRALCSAILLGCIISISAWPLVVVAQQGRTNMFPQQVLQRLVGEWHYTGTVLEGWRQRQEESNYSTQPILHGHFLQQTSDEYTKLYTYDEAAGVYRYWFFTPTGLTAQATGHWDPDTQSLVWDATSVPGAAISVTHHFVGDDTIELTIVIHDSYGNLLYRNDGRSTRIK